MNATFIEAASILVREGLEAILVLAALAAYLGRIGAEHRLRALWLGAGAALIASIVSAWVFEQFYNGMHNDIAEGVMIFAAAGLMFYVSGWLFLKQDPQA
jgi:high-affinity iron transporter